MLKRWNFFFYFFKETLNVKDDTTQLQFVTFKIILVENNH